jgi:uncharacterized protein (DUF1778 family)
MPLGNVSVKEDRLSIRVPRELKKNLIHAAAISGVTLGDFVIANSAQAADRIIQSHRVITLTAQDYDSLMQALNDAPQPNRALLKAAESYNSAIAEGQLTVEN